MSDEMKNCCPPETTAPPMHAHAADSKTEDIKPKLITTAHKRLSQDEFQRKVAMVAYVKAAEDMGMNAMEKEALLGALLGMGRAAVRGGLPLFSRYLSRAATAGGAKTWGNLLPRAMMAAGNSKAIAPLTAGAGQAKSWLNLPTRMMFGEKGLGSAALLPFTHAGYGAVTAAPLAMAGMPYVGGALQRAGQALGGTVGMGGGGSGTPGMGGLMNGGLLGAGAGAIAGALMPGQEEYEDENGNVRKRSRGMLSGALRGAGMGGLAGGAIGAGMEHFGPKMASAQNFGARVAQLEKQAGPPNQLLGAQQPTMANSAMQQSPLQRFGAGLQAAGANAARGMRSGAGLAGALMGSPTGAATQQVQDKLLGPKAPPFAR